MDAGEDEELVRNLAATIYAGKPLYDAMFESELTGTVVS